MLAIEQCLLQQLPSLFTPDKVYCYTDTKVHELAAENGGDVAERTRVLGKLKVLEGGLRDLRRLDKHRVLSQGKLSTVLPALKAASNELIFNHG